MKIALELGDRVVENNMYVRESRQLLPLDNCYQSLGKFDIGKVSCFLLSFNFVKDFVQDLVTKFIMGNYIDLVEVYESPPTAIAGTTVSQFGFPV